MNQILKINFEFLNKLVLKYYNIASYIAHYIPLKSILMQLSCSIFHRGCKMKLQYKDNSLWVLQIQ